MSVETAQDVSEPALQMARKEVYAEILEEAIAARDEAQAEIDKLSAPHWRNTAITVVNFLEPAFKSIDSRLEGVRLSLKYREEQLALLRDAEHVTYNDFGDKSGIKFRIEGTLANGRRILMERDYDFGKGGVLRGARYTNLLENSNGKMKKMNRNQRSRYMALRPKIQQLDTAARERAYLARPRPAATASSSAN